MQTFLPYRFEATARALDDRRLGKQRVEALQTLRALTRPVYGWKRHPAVLMWSGYEEALAAYGVAVCREWRRRGHADTCEGKILDDALAGGVVQVRGQRQLAPACCRRGWATKPSTAATGRRSSARTRSATGRGSTTSTVTSSTCGRYGRGRSAMPQAFNARPEGKDPR